MRTLRLTLAGTVILLLLDGLGAAPVVAQPEGEDAAAVPSSTTTVEVLSDRGVIPLDAIPEDADHVSFVRLSVQPGVSGEVGSSQPQQWASLEYVEEGTGIATSAERSRIWRADGTSEDTPAGVASSFSAGDTLLSYDGAAAIAFENPGPDESVSYLVLPANSRDPDVEPVLVPGVEWRLVDYVFPHTATAEAWFSAPIAVSYERITWEPGAQLVLGSDEVPMLSFIWLEDGRLKHPETPADEVAEIDLVSNLFAGSTWHGQAPSDDTVYVLRNEGDEPAVAIGVTLSHATETGPAAMAEPPAE